MNDISISLELDSCIIEAQVSELKSALLDKFATFENIPSDISGQIESLLFNVVLGDPIPTLTTTGKTHEIVYRPQFGSGFENFISALRA